MIKFSYLKKVTVEIDNLNILFEKDDAFISGRTSEYDDYGRCKWINLPLTSETIVKLHDLKKSLISDYLANKDSR